MKKLKLGIVILLALMLALIPLLGACAEEEATTTPPTTTPPSGPEYGGVLEIIGGGRPVENLGFPPMQTSPSDAFYVGQVCVESLFSFDAQGSTVPNLATGWEFSPDYKSLTITLRQGVKFHDGTIFNAEAVKYDLDLYRASPKPELAAVQSIDVVGDYTVRLNLLQFDALLLTNLSGLSYAGYMISPTAHQTYGDEWCIANPVGTGPFKFISWEHDVSIKYEKFADYWQEGKPYLDGLEFVFIVDPMVALASFEAGEADAILLESPKNAYDLEQTGEYVVNLQPNVTLALGGDSANADSPFADVRVRQAVAYAIDTKAIVDAVSYGFFQVASQPASPGTPAYNPDIVGYSYDPVKARELLAEAAADGVFEPNDLGGFDTKLIIPGGFTEITDAFTAVQGYLDEVGIHAEIEQAGTAIFHTYSENGWENGLIFRVSTVGPAANIASYFQQGLSSEGTMYVSVAFPTDYEAKLHEALAETDPVKRKTLIQELVKMVVDDYCLVSCLYIAPYLLAKCPEVHDLMMDKPHITQWVPTYAWISGAKPTFAPPPTTAPPSPTTTPPPTTTAPPAAGVNWSDVPIYTGAVLVQDTAKPQPFPGGPTYSKTETQYYETADAWDAVKAFYVAELANQGWQIGGMGDWMDESIAGMAGVPTMKAMAVFTKGGDAEGLTVMVYLADNKTRIMLEKSEK
jgi:peptide/nickel transport system substrate-binding protein